MGRFEEQLGELREMLYQQLNPGAKKKDASPKQDGSKTQSFILGEDKRSAPPKPSGSSGSNSTWEQMKAAMLGNAPPASSDDAVIPGAEPQEEDDREREVQPLPAAPLREVKVELKDRPAEIDLQSSDRTALIGAIQARDEHIDHLMDVIEDLKREAGQVDLAELKQQKEEMAEKLRKAEIEMSMERAKLAREAARLKQYETDLAKPAAIPKKGGTPAESADEKGNRWKRFLGSK
jgi:hypothetical protein